MNVKKKREQENQTAASVSKRQRRRVVMALMLLLVSVALVVFAFNVANRPAPYSISPAHTDPFEEFSEADLKAFFEREVMPAFNTYSAQNREAAKRIIRLLSAEIDSYRNNVPAFVDDVTGWGTRFGIIGKSAMDYKEKWMGDPEKAKNLESYMSRKFEQHIFSDRQLLTLIETSLRRFRDDIHANRNQFHASIASSWAREVNMRQDLEMDRIVTDIELYTKQITDQMAFDSVTVGMAAFIGGFAIEQAVQKLVETIYVIIRSALATKTIVGATTAVKCMVAGGTGGSALGPWGTVGGIAAGIMVGIAVEYWVSEELKQKMTVECHNLINNLHRALITGTKNAPGLQHAFTESIKLMENAEKKAIYMALKEIKK